MHSNNPEFYRQLCQDPDQITTAALHLLARKFNLTPRYAHLRLVILASTHREADFDFPHQIFGLRSGAPAGGIRMITSLILAGS